MRRALPPVGWQSIMEQLPHMTVVWAWLKTVVMLKQPGHLTSMKNEFGDCTNRVSLCFRFSSADDGCNRSFTYTRKQSAPAGNMGRHHHPQTNDGRQSRRAQ